MIEVTIKGPAGAGKSILAQALARMVHGSGHSVRLFDDGGGFRDIETNPTSLQVLDKREVRIEVIDPLAGAVKERA